ncbi:MAG TPA: phosphatidylserine/phosphatidylglycerophosphate/cardiolipin synthase family protein [Gemmatimonadales bacterium]|jgi:cardiolipin synthase
MTMTANSPTGLASETALERIATIAQAPIRYGHYVRILRDGALAFPAMLALMRAAKRSVCFENFIFANDDTGEEFASGLEKARIRGAEVRVLYDPLGTLLVKGGSIARRLRKARVNARPFRPVSMALPWSWFHFTHRDHRKLLIADDLAAVVGGLCIADHWSPAERGGGGWRDTALLVRGPAVADLQLAFERMWRRALGAVSERKFTTLMEARALTLPPPRGEAKVIVVGDRPRTQRVAALYTWLADNAERSIDISDAYFVAPRRVSLSLINAARRGVRVRLLLPGRNNHPVAGLAAQRIYGPLLAAGAEIHEWNGVMLHAKSLVVDGVISMVGSSNLDPLSLHRNYELNVLVSDPAVGGKMCELFETDIAAATPVHLDQWEHRPWHYKAAEQIASLFGWNL